MEDIPGGAQGSSSQTDVPAEQVQEDDTMREYPLVPLKSTVIFPHTRVNLTIGRDKSVRAVEEAHKAGKQFVAAA